MITTLLLAPLQQHDHPTIGTIDTVRPPADLGDGDVALTALKASGDVLHRHDAATLVRLAGSVESFHYDWSATAAGLPRDLSAYRLDAMYPHGFDERWKGVALLSTSFQFEEAADAADGGTFGGGVGVLYQAGPELSMGVALLSFSRIEEDPRVMLLPYVEWQLSPAWTLRTEAKEGAGLEASYALDGVWSLQAKAVVQERRFRLDDEGLRPEGVFGDTRVSILVGVLWKPSGA